MISCFMSSLCKTTNDMLSVYNLDDEQHQGYGIVLKPNKNWLPQRAVGQEKYR